MAPSRDRPPRRNVRSLIVRCEQGYLCEVCGAAVEDLFDFDLYPRYVLGEEGFRITRGYFRLREVLALGLPIAFYPLPGTH
ncbi:MAG TPA: hypothetical protein VJY33_15005 [Isosphaeraceae bacterium]|nr:hypothetical protein [Isosphaeraceae bacterium]